MSLGLSVKRINILLKYFKPPWGTAKTIEDSS